MEENESRSCGREETKEITIDKRYATHDDILVEGIAITGLTRV